MSSNKNEEWKSIIGEQTRAWENLLEAYGEIAKVLSGNGMPLEDHYDDMDETKSAFNKASERTEAFLREWHQEQI
jgi:hypothetical protein